jgi:hypothetical protein
VTVAGVPDLEEGPMVLADPRAEVGRRSPTGEDTGKALRDARLSRFEFKYVIERSLVPQIRDFMRAFCVPDPHAAGTPPEYVVTTLQLDSPDLALYHAIDREAVNRFKLRVRSYDIEDGSPAAARPSSGKKDGRLVMEVKRKLAGAIVKTRAGVRRDDWGDELVAGRATRVEFGTEEEHRGYLDFARLAAQIGARPVLAVRYAREPYLSTVDRYARVTFDRALCYQMWRQWDFPGDGGRWLSMDSASALRRTRSCVVLELKTLGQVPVWMVDLVQRFNLVRTNFCKYAMALRVESLFQPHLDRFDFS